MSVRRKLGHGLGLALSTLALTGVAAPAAQAQADPSTCTQDIQFDPGVRTWDQVFPNSPIAGNNSTGVSQKHLTQDLYTYAQAVMADVANSPRVRILERDIGPTVLGKRLKYYILGTPGNVANLDAGRDDGAFWRGVITGEVSAAEALTQVRARPAFAWITATPHGNEPAAGEAISRQLYELAARTDCHNIERLDNLTLFLDPARNPDGRDANSRYTAWGFDGNRDFGTRNQPENRLFMPEINKYPGLFFIDAHQNTGSYFFPPNEDPVHHEISQFALDFIQHRIGPAIQQKFNDQSINYRNYNTYDLFTPEYGDTVPALLMGSAGMTYEQPTGDAYGRQIYQHFLAIDTTINVTSRDKVQLLTDWIKQWQEAIDQGAACKLQENKLVSPLHTVIEQQPSGTVCGYFYKPGLHSGDVAKLMRDLQSTGVNVYRLDQDVTVANGVHHFGPGGSVTDTLPAGTLWIPMAQPQKHWIQAVLGEEPFVPFPYFYDVATWSYSLLRGLAGNGVLTTNMPSGVAMTHVSVPPPPTVPRTASAVYAFNADSMQSLGLAVDLINAGATVYRAKDAFDVDGRHYDTGAVLVDGATITGPDLALRARSRDTPVAGLTRFPAARYAIAKPKVAIWTGSANIVPNPEHGTPCTNASDYCWVRFTLQEKVKIPAAQLVGLTSTQISAGALNDAANAFTAIIIPRQYVIAADNPIAEHVRTFVNNGGRFLSYYTGGTTSARNVGLTLLNTEPIRDAQGNELEVITPGSTYDGEFDTANPLAWGFDKGGFLYRDQENNNAIYAPASLAGGTGTGNTVVPPATAPIRYKVGGKSYGYEQNSIGPGKLDGRPAVVDQPFGAGRAFLFAGDPFFRAWNESVERQALNALLYPAGALIPADPPSGAAGAAPVTGRPAGAGRGQGGVHGGTDTDGGSDPGQAAAGARQPPGRIRRPFRERRQDQGLEVRQHGAAQGGQPPALAEGGQEAGALRDQEGHGHARDQGCSREARPARAQLAARAAPARPQACQGQAAALAAVGLETGEGRRIAGPPDCLSAALQPVGWSGQDRAEGRHGSLVRGGP